MTYSKPESRESSQQRKENAYVDLLPETSKLVSVSLALSSFNHSLVNDGVAQRLSTTCT